MEDYYFESQVRTCKEIEEATSFLEIFNYSDGDTYFDKGALPMSEFYNFLNRTGVFEPPKKKPDVKIISGLRLVLQLRAQHPETFTSNYISFSHSQYIDMVRKLDLPYRAIEATSVVGPFFWSAFDLDDANPHQQIIFRKSDVRKKGLTRGWELMLSHELRSGITTGYAKGTESSNLDKTIDQHLRPCAKHVAHPLLLPTVLIGHDLNSSMDDKQRMTRHWLRKLEHSITDRNEIDANESYASFDLDLMNSWLVECHSQVLWKRPRAFIDTLEEMTRAMDAFRAARDRLQRDNQLPPHLTTPDRLEALDRLHRDMTNRYSFFRMKLKGIHHYAQTTLARLDVQRGALYNIIAQKESKLNLEMAHHQRLLGLAAKRDSQSMKALSVVGALFLPATLLSSLFSMTFFDFQGGDTPKATVAPSLWVYFAITIPTTLLVLGALLWWDKQREKKFADEEKSIETVPVLEKRVVSSLREKRTGLNDMDTKRWDTL